MAYYEFALFYVLNMTRLALGRFEDAACLAWEGALLKKDNEELKVFFFFYNSYFLFSIA